jgi:capsule polysaccharide export protein KpsE/RkpR
MTENLLETVRQILQDNVAPDVRELKARMTSMEREMAALRREMQLQFEAVMIELRAQRGMAALSERIAVLEERGRK